MDKLKLAMEIYDATREECHAHKSCNGCVFYKGDSCIVLAICTYIAK